MRSASDRDWFVFNIPANSQYWISLTNLPARYNMQLMKQGASSVLNVATATDTHPEVERLINLSTKSGGKYYLVVYSVDGTYNTETPYGVTVEHAPIE